MAQLEKFLNKVIEKSLSIIARSCCHLQVYKTAERTAFLYVTLPKMCDLVLHLKSVFTEVYIETPTPEQLCTCHRLGIAATTHRIQPISNHVTAAGCFFIGMCIFLFISVSCREDASQSIREISES